MDDLGTLRMRSGTLIGHGSSPDSKAIILGGDPARYVRVGPRTVEFLQTLAREELGMTVQHVRRNFPTLAVGQLVEMGLIDYVDPLGQAVDKAMVLELWRRNVGASFRIKRHGWSAVERRMSPSASDVSIGLARPLLFDSIEAAARLSFALAGTSKQCTVVALAIHAALTSRRFPARIDVIVTSDQLLMHSCVMVGKHRVDPNDTLIEGTLLRPIQRASADMTSSEKDCF